jgi:KTSC domain
MRPQRLTRLTEHSGRGGMTRQPVASSSLASIGFDPATNELEIEFRAGGIYRYAVPRRVHRELMAADSHGGYFARSIRHTYPGWRVAK